MKAISAALAALAPWVISSLCKKRRRARLTRISKISPLCDTRATARHGTRFVFHPIIFPKAADGGCDPSMSFLQRGGAEERRGIEKSESSFQITAVQISGLTKWCSSETSGCERLSLLVGWDWVPDKNQFNLRRLNLCTKYAAFSRT